MPSLGLADDVPAGRFRDRRQLLGRLDDRPPRLAPAVGQDFDDSRRRAFALVSSAEMRRAFGLSREPAAGRDRYGGTAGGSRTCWPRAWSRPSRASSPP